MDFTKHRDVLNGRASNAEMVKWSGAYFGVIDTSWLLDDAISTGRVVGQKPEADTTINSSSINRALAVVALTEPSPRANHNSVSFEILGIDKSLA